MGNPGIDGNNDRPKSKKDLRQTSSDSTRMNMNQGMGDDLLDDQKTSSPSEQYEMMM